MKAMYAAYAKTRSSLGQLSVASTSMGTKASCMANAVIIVPSTVYVQGDILVCPRWTTSSSSSTPISGIALSWAVTDTRAVTTTITCTRRRLARRP
eukprot:scaffold510_cov242-Pinguiococcus_pyrenoidosus.AAC.22